MWTGFVQRTRLNPASSVILVALVSLVAGLMLALWFPRNPNLPRVLGAFCIIPGLFLLLWRNLFIRDPAVAPTPRQIAVEHQIRRGFRAVGASQVLFGIAQIFPDIQMRTAVSLCGVAVSMAALFKIPRRFFDPMGSA